MVAYIYSREQHQSCICFYAHSITPHIAMVTRGLKWCQRIRCGRQDKHRTRRVDADGRPDCLGNHGQCGMALRGCMKRLAQEQSNRIFRVAKRLRSKLSPDRVTYALRVRAVAPGPLLLPVSPTRHMDPSALAANHQNARASGAHQPVTPPVRVKCNSPPPAPTPPSSFQDVLMPNSLMFQIICEYIDKEKTKDHMDEGERHGLKATAFRLCVTISSHQACKTAFAPRANEALLTPSVVRWRRSLALAVLLTALGLSAFTSSSVTPETLARAIERDATIRANARKSQCSIINFLHRNNAFFR